ncbi:Fumarylacetoacetate hydrolase [Candidatus Desulfarcum epimagneticum]|uniref:Fumarylacetoacetate hydrolase n=1 Tax=uncultured Desulfobacteraceae bacterium TaxID=218296 RepID=A0A484HH41_9BACT|nr:Fumarylacetoacetate hydrolase [uncultured Desulfobacteraceae bacterium]
MKISLVKDALPHSKPFPALSMDGRSWRRAGDLAPEGVSLDHTVDILAFERAHPGTLAGRLSEGENPPEALDMSRLERLIPFEPLSYRDFMLYEKHFTDAARGFVKKYLPGLAPFTGLYEKISGRTFPKFKPGKRWEKFPIYYMGNHLSFFTHKDPIRIPSYSKELDYELELGAIICAPLENASPEEAEKAIGGFVVLNDFSARDVQLDEMRSGFGPVKAKNFANAVSNVVTGAKDILPMIPRLKVRVSINGEKIVETDMSGMRHSLPEAIAYASLEERLRPGEFFGSGTVPGCSGIENGRLLKRGDSIRLEIEGVGALENRAV